MNKREKKMLFLTSVVLLIGICTWLFSGDDPKKKSKKKVANAQPSKESATSNSSGQSNVNQSSSKAPESSAQITKQKDSATPNLLTGDFELSEKGIENLIAARSLSKKVTLKRDPFQSPDIAPKEISKAPANIDSNLPELPQVDAIYMSGSTRGAVLNGKVCFAGNRWNEFELVSVSATSIELRYGQKLIRVFNTQNSPKENELNTKETTP